MTTPENSLLGLRNDYRTPARVIAWWARHWPSLAFYVRFIAIIYRSSAKARRGRYDSAEWARSSLAVLRALESVGLRVTISGTGSFAGLDGPCVFVANHMSMLETMVLPVIIQPVKEVTFIVKQSLLNYPVFRHIMRSRDPVVVGRSNPRRDFQAVMAGGTARLDQGRSLIVFPQTTRTESFESKQVNTIGVKLARRAKVSLVPVALLTDAWGNGKWLKDFGRIDPSRQVHFAFGSPLQVRGRGDEEHAAIIEFISAKLRGWRQGISPERQPDEN